MAIPTPVTAAAGPRPAIRHAILHRRGLGRVPSLDGAVAAVGVAAALATGREGSPGWQLARASVVLAITAAVLVGLSHASARWRGRAAVAVGITALPTGFGLAPHVVKRGDLVLSLAGLVLALGGLALVAGGTAVATRGRRRFRRTATAVTVLAAAAAVTFVVGPAVAVTNVPRPAIGEDPASVGLDFSSVWLETTDQVRLAAWWVPSTNGAALVLRHGAGSTRSDVLDHAAVLARHGYGVLLVDARGHGDSGGRAMDFGWHGDADIAAATAFLATADGVDPDRIGVLGLSMGGEEAIGASASNPTIRAVVAEGATARSAGDEAWLSDVHGWRGAIQERLELVQDWVTDGLTSASPPIANDDAVVAAPSTRYLLIAAGKVAPEAHTAAFIDAAAPDRVDVWIVEGAGHTAGLDTEPAAWERRVIAFLDATLPAEGG